MLRYGVLIGTATSKMQTDPHVRFHDKVFALFEISDLKDGCSGPPKYRSYQPDDYENNRSD